MIISVNISEEMVSKLDVYARQCLRSRSKALEYLVRDALAGVEAPDPVPSDRAPGGKLRRSNPRAAARRAKLRQDVQAAAPTVAGTDPRAQAITAAITGQGKKCPHGLYFHPGCND